MYNWREEYDEWRKAHVWTQYETRKEIDKVMDNKLEELLDKYEKELNGDNKTTVCGPTCPKCGTWLNITLEVAP